MARIDYEEASRSYDRARGLALDGLEGWRRAVSAHIPVGARVVDIGAGTGQWALAFATWFGARVAALEPSLGMRSQVAEKVRSLPVECVAACGEAIPLRTGSCDAAWLSTVIHHLRDLHGCAREVRRVVKQDGVALVRSAFPGRTGNVSLFRFFPEAAAVVETFPTIDATVAAFEGAGFDFGGITPVEQVTASDLRAYRARVANRSADTTLRLMDDAAYARGLARVDDAIAHGEGGHVVDALDLLVFR